MEGILGLPGTKVSIGRADGARGRGLALCALELGSSLRGRGGHLCLSDLPNSKLGLRWVS